MILPQAFKKMVPPLMNQSIMQLKNTSLLSVLAVPDLLYQGQVIAHDTYRPLELYTFIAIAYFAVLLPITIWAKRMEFGPARKRSDMASPLIEIANLKKAFGQNVVLKDISLQIERGQVVAMIGPSGSGKSTLLRCINLLSIPNAGRITVGEQTIEFDGARTTLPSERSLARFRASTGMVFQHFNLFLT